VNQTYSVFASIALAVITLCAQNAAIVPSFDAASVKIWEKGMSVPGQLRMKGGPGTADPGRLTWGRASLLQMIAEAWDFELTRIAGPEWLGFGSSGYRVVATMPVETSKQEFRAMFRNLLLERFQIKFHHESRSYPGYELVVAPGGPRLTVSAEPDAPEPEDGGPGGLDANGFLLMPPGRNQGVAMRSDGVYAKFQYMTMAEFAASPYFLQFVPQSNGSNSYVLDKTALTGRYDFTLKFDARGNADTAVVGTQVQRNQPAGQDESSGLPGITKAIEKQLGLRLVKSKGFLLDTIVVDSALKIPIDN
jgi:uncharacterized protein (TIGR03435 family)